MYEITSIALSTAKSSDELVEGAIAFFQKDIERNPDFFGLKFETLCAGRRSKKIREEFNAGINQRVAHTKRELSLSMNPQSLKRFHISSWRCIMELQFR